MIPLRDDNPVSTTPWVTYALIAINVAVFALQWIATAGGSALSAHLGLVPAALVAHPLAAAPTLITSMFLHGGLLHLAGNMWFLYLFGDNVEDRLGKPRFILFYLASGIGAGLLQVAVGPASTIPMIGASGAIAGVLGAYALLWPRAQVVTLVWLLIFIRLIRLPAILFIGIWFGIQFLQGVGSLGAAASGGVAYWAHVGGFLVGAGVGYLLRARAPHRSRPAPTVRRIHTAGSHPGVIIRLEDHRRHPTVH